MTIDIFGDPETCVKIYNPNEPDTSKKLIDTFDNYFDAGAKLGMPPKVVFRACATKNRVYSSVHNMEIAIRLASNK